MSLLKKKNILITAGSTRGFLDAVRYITNTSTGRLGSEIALEAMGRGADVTYIYGADSLFPVIHDRNDINPSQLKLIEIETNNDLMEILQKKLKNRKFDAIIHAMAVADYVPASAKQSKTSSQKEEWLVKLVKTPKVINSIRTKWPEALLVGFKLEVNKTKDEIIKIARRFLTKSKANLIVANDYKYILRNRHIAYMVTGDRKIPKPLKGKKAIARNIISCLESTLA
ncbi:MAG: Coenzyme A biosynthesis bifunctional protein CoaBC [Candidatus Scalindua arabica]|uniref:Coenzyme A biosynthesis bifunctional protein CoaBC n=1 Tax=Candidatus Scalindua arabica TaxID=1127984 RepID=A0A941W3E4_9BACT|nr:Coenzyme A biosynthesis bifunctional protein CoaBC [Candidatus Scalindua arabica]